MTTSVPIQTPDGKPMVVRVSDNAGSRRHYVPSEFKTTAAALSTAVKRLHEQQGWRTPRSSSGPATPTSIRTPVPRDPVRNVMERQEIEKMNAGLEDLMVEPLEPIVEGLDDKDLWTMLRRFDAEVNHVLAPAGKTPPGQPDLRMSSLPDVGFRSDTLKSYFERVVLVAGPTWFKTIRELTFITDWDNHFGRTAVYCSAYFIAWWYGITILACGAFAAVLIASPEIRHNLFPNNTDSTNPKENEDTTLIALAPGQHRSKSEQAEEEAYEFRTMFEVFCQTILLGGERGACENSSVGPKTPEHIEHDDPIICDAKGQEVGRRLSADSGIESPDAIVGGQAIHINNGVDLEEVVGQEIKRKRDAKLGRMLKILEDLLGTIADLFEVIQHALTPPPHYPDHYARYKLAAVLVVVPALAIHFVPARLVGRALTFLIGTSLWGSGSCLKRLKNIDIKWKDVLDIRNSILSKTPTNAQLILHILRVSEEHGEPLAAPPPLEVDRKARKALADPDPPDGLTREEHECIDRAASRTELEMRRMAVKSKRHLASAFKSMAGKVAGLGGDVSVNGKEKRVANMFKEPLLKRRFGDGSPDAYPCQLRGKPGHFLVDGVEGRVAFISLEAEQPERVWPIDDILELKKDQVSVARMTVGMFGGAAVDSLGLGIRMALPGDHESMEKETEKTAAFIKKKGDLFHFERVRRRDKLFNRLLALGSQRWELL